jgi:mRNA interferase MazF
MTSFEFGQLVLVRFPFTDQHGSKQRPAVVISNSAYNQARPDIILMAVTSQIRSKLGFGEAAIEDWQAAGLLKPSLIKPIVFTAEKSIIRKSLGQLEEKDNKSLKIIIDAVIG